MRCLQSEWEKLRHARLADAVEEKRQKEDEGLTFSPTLSRRSRKLASRTFRTPRLRMLQVKPPHEGDPNGILTEGTRASV